jgi:CheY-like chemotaxis protein
VKVLVIDDEIGRLGGLENRTFSRRYGRLGIEFVFESCSGSGSVVAQAVRALNEAEDLDLVLLDLHFQHSPDEGGFEILAAIRAGFIEIPVLVMSALSRDVQALARVSSWEQPVSYPRPSIPRS